LVLVDPLHELHGRGGGSANCGGEGGGGGDHGFVGLIVLGHVAEGVACARACERRGRGRASEEEEGASSVSIWPERVKGGIEMEGTVVRVWAGERWLRRNCKE
jgi:hypothetical protein